MKTEKKGYVAKRTLRLSINIHFKNLPIIYVGATIGRPRSEMLRICRKLGAYVT